MSASSETGLRVLAWNVERKKPSTPRGAEAYAYAFGLDPDVMVLTEACTSMPLHGGHVVWPDLPRGSRFAADERKIGLWSRWPLRNIGEFNHPGLDPTRFVAGVIDSPIGPVRVVGVCVPYQMAEVTHPVDVKRKPWELHLAYLDALGELLRRNDMAMIVAGDYNQAVPRTHAPYLVADALTIAFAPLQIVTAGRLDGCGRVGIDHIALSEHLEAAQVWGWPHDVTGNRLSDHDGAGAVVRLRDPR